MGGIPYSGYFSRGLIVTVFAVGHRPRKFNPEIIRIHVLVLILFVWVRDSMIRVDEPSCVVNLQWDMALLQLL